MNQEAVLSEQEKESLKFLQNDYNQSFGQMRHYDDQIFSTLKFLFTVYSALVGVALGMHKLGVEKNIDLSSPMAMAISVGFMAGICMLILMVRNRVYYVHVARYINEQRALFFKFQPLGFRNISGMYTNPEKPPFFNWRSSHSWMMYIVSSMNSFMLSVLIYLIYNKPDKWSFIIFLGLFLLVVQLIASIGYLFSRENKSADESVFGG